MEDQSLFFIIMAYTFTIKKLDLRGQNKWDVQLSHQTHKVLLEDISALSEEQLIAKLTLAGYYTDNLNDFVEYIKK